VVDLAALGHLLEQGLAPIALQQFASKTYESPMHVGGRQGGGYTVDVGGGHDICRFDLNGEPPSANTSVTRRA
jgi:hypothetical protein